MTTAPSGAVGRPPALSRDALVQIARRYPPSERAEQAADVDRILDHVSMVSARIPRGGAVLDLCGGIGMFSLGCAAAGMAVTLVDDFNDANNRPVADEALRLHREMGVDVIRADILERPPEIPAGSMDAVTCFDAMEHWHRSAKRVLRQAVGWLRPGGLFLLQTPNCVNLRKRISVPLGRGKWSGMEHWYEQDVFRGHVREPDVDDLRYIARDLGLRGVEILGRNWLGHGSRRAAIRAATRVVDRLLRRRPSLCSNIYLMGIKP